MQQVIRLLLKKSRMESFGQTYQAMAAGKPMAAFDHLNKLSPFMDDQNLMRLKGRLRHAGASYEMKYPILLSAKHPIVRKLIEVKMLTKVTITKERSMFGSRITG